MIMLIITDISGIYGKITTGPGLHHYNNHCISAPVPVPSVGQPPLSLCLSRTEPRVCVTVCQCHRSRSQHRSYGATVCLWQIYITDYQPLQFRMCNKVIALFLLSLNSEFLYVQPQRYEHQERPVFDEHLPSNVTVQQGDTAYLHCRIFNAENM